MDKLVFMFEQTISTGFVEENGWLSPSPLESIEMKTNISEIA